MMHLRPLPVLTTLHLTPSSISFLNRPPYPSRYPPSGFTKTWSSHVGTIADSLTIAGTAIDSMPPPISAAALAPIIEVPWSPGWQPPLPAPEHGVPTWERSNAVSRWLFLMASMAAGAARRTSTRPARVCGATVAETEPGSPVPTGARNFPLPKNAILVCHQHGAVIPAKVAWAAFLRRVCFPGGCIIMINAWGRFGFDGGWKAGIACRGPAASLNRQAAK